MNLGRYVACICEGSAERAILYLLLDADKLIFNRDKLIDNEIIKDRKAESFERKYLGKEFEEKTPEIEMLIIFNENKYTDFKKLKNVKPSDYCKSKLKYKNVKTYDFVKDYFDDIDKLLKAIKEYKSKSQIKKGEYTLCDLLK